MLLLAATSCVLTNGSFSSPSELENLQSYKERFLPSKKQSMVYSHGNHVGGNSKSCFVMYQGPPSADSDPIYPDGAAVAIGIVSALKNRGRRDAIRRTWLRLPELSSPAFPTGTFEYAFFLGLDEDGEIPIEVVEEMNEFHDIVIVNRVDSYKNMIYKVVSIFLWGSRSCGASYILRSNDDVYLSLASIFSYLLKEVPVNMYVGHFLTDILVLRPEDETSPTFEKSSQISYSTYPSDVYPPFAQGNAYILSRDLSDVVTSLIDSPWRRLFADDLLVGLMMDSNQARKVLIKADFALDGGRNVCSDDSLFHFDVTVESMDSIFRNDVEGRRHCEGVEVL